MKLAGSLSIHSIRLKFCQNSLKFAKLALSITVVINDYRERSGSVVECLTRDRGAAGSSLTGVTVL